jgi:hypothetical protein
MPRSSDPLYWAATRVYRQLCRGRACSLADDEAGPWVAYLAERQRALARVWERIRTAHTCGWHLAAGRLRERLFFEAHRLEAGTAELLKCEVTVAPTATTPATTAEPLLTPASILAELRQLGSEFDGDNDDEVEVRTRQQVVAVHTGPVTLQGVSLGPFAIELHLERLGRGRTPGADCFDCVALEPTPASGDDAVTHPHVKGKTLCAGDATVPLAAALRSGRLADAFLLVRGVLHHYNPASAYASLREWHGSPCGECGRAVGPDDAFYCEQCGHDVCDGCFDCCGCCGRGLCRVCLDADPVSDRLCCHGCRQECRRCGRIVDRDSFDADGGLCPECRGEDGGDAAAAATDEDDEPQTPPIEEDDPDADRQRPEPANRAREPAGPPDTIDTAPAADAAA